MFAPGYDGRPGDGQPGGDGAARSRVSAGATVGKGPVRGYPPAPGQPPPVYPPGQFAAWNRGRTGGPAPSQPRPTAGETPQRPSRYYAPPDGDTDPGYSLLAVSDPAADVTDTQTWKAVAEGRATGTWTMPPEVRRGASQTQPTRPADPLPRRDPIDPRRVAGTGRSATIPPGAPAPPARPAQPTRPATGPVAPPSHRAPRTTGGRPPEARAPAGRSRAVSDFPDTPPGRSADPPTTPGTRMRHGAHTGQNALPGRRHRPASVKLAVAGALVLVLGAAGALYVGVLRTPAKPHTTSQSVKSAATASPTPSPTQTLGPYGRIATRGDDPDPLTIAQLYPPKFVVFGVTMVRTADQIGTNCGAAVAGSGLQQALSAAGCNQVVRATYLTVKQGMMGTIGVLNLTSGSAAKRTTLATGANNFIAQVPGRKAPTSKIGQGPGIEMAAAKGHYLILIWAEFTNLRGPKTAAQRKELASFMTELLNKTANVSLTNRFLTGRP